MEEFKNQKIKSANKIEEAIIQETNLLTKIDGVIAESKKLNGGVSRLLEYYGIPLE